MERKEEVKNTETGSFILISPQLEHKLLCSVA